MVERELDSLIQDVLDGVATPEEVARLEARLGRDPAARARQAELARLFGALGSARRFEAPPELKTSILRSLPPGAPGVRTITPVATGRQLRLAYVFAAGLAAGVIAAGALTGFWKVPPGGAPVVGSMMPAIRPAAGTPVRSAQWQAGPTRVEARSWRAGTSRLASFRVQGPAAEIELAFDPGSLAWEAFRSAPEARRATLEPGRVAFRGTEQSETVVELREPTPRDVPLKVTIRAGGQTAAGELPAPPAPSAK